MKPIFEVERDGFKISTDPKLLDMNTVYDFLARAYWSKKRPHAKTDEAFANSLTFGLYKENRLIGMARVITDYSIVAYLCDVFIDDAYRGDGLGKWLVESVLSHPNLKEIRRWLLATDDAHELYRRYGFSEVDHPENWMQRFRPFPGE